MDALGDAGRWLDGIAASKIDDFAGEADACDADVLSRYSDVKRVALLACLVHTARARARDDLAQMLCKRVAVNVKKAKAKLEEIQKRERAVTEKLIGTYKGVLEGLAPNGAVGVAQEAATQMVLIALAALTGNVDGVREGQAAGEHKGGHERPAFPAGRAALGGGAWPPWRRELVGSRV